MAKNLFEKLRPEAKRKLMTNKIYYPESVRKILKLLTKKNFVSDLKISQIMSIYNYTDSEFPTDPVEAIYCETIFDTRQ